MRKNSIKDKLQRVFFSLVSTGMGLIFLALVSCAPLKPQTDPALDKKANRLARDASSLNQEIKSSRGIGWVEIQTQGRRDKFKLAWAANAPNQLRLTLLVSGHPVETIVATGKHVTFISHTGDHSPHTTLSGDPSLETFIKVPIKLSQMIKVLRGQIPLEPFENAWFEPEKKTFIPIILTKKWKSGHQKLYVDKHNQVQRLVSFNKDNTPVYDITYIEYQTHGQSRIPATLLIQDVAGRKIRLSLTRFIPNPPIKESIFRLTESGS